MSISQISHISNIAITMLWWTPVARPRGTTWRQSAWKPHAPCVRLWRRRSGLKFVIYMVGFFFLSLMMLLPVYIYIYMNIIYIYIYVCVHIQSARIMEMNKWRILQLPQDEQFPKKNNNYASNRELFPYFLFWEMPGNPQPGMTGVCGKKNCQQKG